MSGHAGNGSEQEILVEFIVRGGSVKVTAIHSESGTEASIVGPARAPRAALEAAASRKLAYVMGKKRAHPSAD
jgi:hypothetical protein